MNPHTYLHYNGPLSDQVGKVLGPNTMGEYFTVVTQEYSAEAYQTTLGLVYGIQE